MDDKEIVGLFFKRDQNALNRLHEKYGRLCRSIAENILKSHVDAEDCVNEVYLKVWDNIPPHKPKSLLSFVARVAKTTAIDIYSMEHAGKRGGGDTAVPFEELDEVIADGSSVEMNAENKELLAEINAFLETLPKKKRTLFVNRYWYFYSVTELAVMYEMKEHNVVTVLSRTRAALKEYPKGGATQYEGQAEQQFSRNIRQDRR